jgi:GNAT superfamily N-acetyltransferase
VPNTSGRFSASFPAADDDARWSLELDGVVISATISPASPLLERFFAGYDRAFVLPDEREELDGFRACLALNPAAGERTHAELVMVASDSRDGQLLGGANFLATRMPAIAGHPPVAVALNYLFVDQAVRGRGLSRRLLQAMARLANRAVAGGGGDGWPAIFIEQNDPLLLSEAESARDTARSGTDQVERLRIWDRLGARIVDFPYVQPALSARQSADDGLAYAAVDFPLPALSPAYLRAHLHSFFGISVLKGRDPGADPDAGAQLELLQAMARDGLEIALLPMGGALERLSKGDAGAHGMPLRKFARMA